MSEKTASDPNALSIDTGAIELDENGNMVVLDEALLESITGAALALRPIDGVGGLDPVADLNIGACMNDGCDDPFEDRIVFRGGAANRAILTPGRQVAISPISRIPGNLRLP